MRLNEIDTSVYYPVTVPSTGVLTKFRPFRVREERSLMTAQESEDSATMMDTLENIVRSCVVDSPTELTTFDAEYLLLQIRSKSVGEISDVSMACEECEHNNLVAVDISKAELSKNKFGKSIKLAENLVVDLKYPSIKDVRKMLQHKDDPVYAIAACIETVYFNDTVFRASEGELQDIADFLLNRSEEEMSLLVQFVENIPTLTLGIGYTCSKCGHKNEIVLKNLSDFF